jgi:DNA polymerase I-like protein with 3'-5' exonuclease and polymerase domains
MAFEGEGKTFYSLDIMSWILTKEGNPKAIMDKFGGIAKYQQSLEDEEKASSSEEDASDKEIEDSEEENIAEEAEEVQTPALPVVKQVIRVPLMEESGIFEEELDDVEVPEEDSSEILVVIPESLRYLCEIEKDTSLIDNFVLNLKKRSSSKVKRVVVEGQPDKVSTIDPQEEAELQRYATFISDSLKQKIDELGLSPIQFYSAMDADVTFRIYKKLLPEIEKDYKELYFDLVMPLTRTLLRLEENGILVDTEYIDTLIRENNIAADKEKQKLFKKLGREFNINSGPELRKVVYEDLKIPVNEK